mgnify:CR=1 FL=1
MELPDNPQEEAEPKPQEEPVAATSTPPISEPTTEEIPYPAPIPVPDATDPDTPLPTTTTTPPQPKQCLTSTREPPAQPDLTTKPASVCLTEPTAELEPSEPLHTNEMAKSMETEADALYLPPVTTPPTAPPHLSRASWTCWTTRKGPMDSAGQALSHRCAMCWPSPTTNQTKGKADRSGRKGRRKAWDRSAERKERSGDAG